MPAEKTESAPGSRRSGKARRPAGRWRRISVVLALVLIVPLLGRAAYMAAVNASEGGWAHWSSARWDSAAIAPSPEEERRAVVQVYAARAYGWRGIFGVHGWIAVKPAGAAAYTRYEVVGWRVRHGGEAVRERVVTRPDGFWAGNPPTLLRDIRGEAAEALIPEIEAAIRAYPHHRSYVVWPGPNSNTFIAWVARRARGLDVALPVTAIGKDFVPGGGFLEPMPSGSGYQLSLFGLLGIGVAAVEGLEINLLGLVVGVDFLRPALKLPGIGRIGMARDPAA